MKNNIPIVHHHHSLRLQGYDYSGRGLYFITICTKNRHHSFGRISKGEMVLGTIGITAEMMLAEVSKHYSHAIVAEHVVMPNHVHLILVLNEIHKFAGDDDTMIDGIRLDVEAVSKVNEQPLFFNSTFFCYHQKKVAKKSHRCMKVTKNLRHSLNCGNSSLRSSNSPQFFTLIP